ncbi:hypothetical protein [Candidatus Poriferisodalis sp.]|uniref:hypothetical protein n=1 Tax=Candidatus Poriferisodalis sp. TaxID=3101277 RepID=UPI003B516C5E
MAAQAWLDAGSAKGWADNRTGAIVEFHPAYVNYIEACRDVTGVDYTEVDYTEAGGHPHCDGWASVLQLSLVATMASIDEESLPPLAHELDADALQWTNDLNRMANDMVIVAIDHLEELGCEEPNEPASSP